MHRERIKHVSRFKILCLSFLNVLNKTGPQFHHMHLIKYARSMFFIDDINPIRMYQQICFYSC